MRTEPTQPSAGQRRALTTFVGLVIAAGAAVIGHSVYSLPGAPNPAGWLSLGVLAIVSASFALKMPGVPVYLSISDAFFITSALLFGPAPATITIAVDSLIVSLRRRNNLRQLLFNCTSCALALWCGVQAFGLLLPQSAWAGDAIPGAAIIGPLGVLAAVYFLLNSGLLAGAVALSNRVSPVAVWREHFAIVSVNYFAAASAAFFLIVLARSLGLAAIAAVIPVILVCHLAMRSWLGRVDDARRHLETVNRLYLSTVSALSTAIEAKDGVTSNHIQRVQAYAMGLARALQITDPSTLQAIEAAALLHDTGKLAIPEHILNKPGKLTAREFEVMKTHVGVGADILSSIDFPYPVVPIVRAHHENWDGSGYPGGLRRDEIPIGARILSVVDCFDALTSDRPYRPAMTDAAAFEIILQRRGAMYDPDIVDTFVRVYRDIEVPKPQAQLQVAVRNIQENAALAAAETTVLPPAASGTASADDLLAFVALARVTSGSPTVADIGAFAWSQLRHLTPQATMTLFVLDDSKVSLVSRHSEGLIAPRLAQMTIGVGDRISGWVAANGRPMVDADAALDLGRGFDDVARFAVSVPLATERGLTGVLTLYGLEPFRHQLALTIEMIAPHLAKALAAVLVTAGPQASAADDSAPRLKAAGLSLVSSR